MTRPDEFDFTTDLDARLVAMEEAKNGDDVPFLVACVRHWRDAIAAEREACAVLAEETPEVDCTYVCGYDDEEYGVPDIQGQRDAIAKAIRVRQ